MTDKELSQTIMRAYEQGFDDALALAAAALRSTAKETAEEATKLLADRSDGIQYTSRGVSKIVTDVINGCANGLTCEPEKVRPQ